MFQEKILIKIGQEKNPSFFSMADTMLLTADRMLSSGAIDKETYTKLYTKYPFGK